MTKYLFILSVLLSVCSVSTAGSLTQTDWSGGSGLEGPVSAFNDDFDTQDDLCWWGAPGSLSLFEGPASNTIGEGGSYALFGDLEPDGDIDMFLRGGYSHICLYINNLDTPSEDWEQTESFVEDEYCNGIGMGPGVDSDGDLDLFTGRHFSPIHKLTVFHRNSYPYWPYAIVAEFDWYGPYEVIDLDGDGDSDLLVRYGDNYSWYSNDGSGNSWTFQGFFYQGASHTGVEDLDGDSDRDLVLATPNSLVLLENDGTGGWTGHTVDSTSSGVHFIKPGFADINGDGVTDIVGGTNSQELLWWENPGSFTDPWTRHTVPGSLTILSVDGGDLDGDGDHDILTGSTTGMHWWENQDGYGDLWQCRQLAGDTVATVSCSQIIEGARSEAVMVSRLRYYGLYAGDGVSRWYNVMDDPPLQGALKSSIVDVGVPAVWDSLYWTEDTPPSTAIGFQLRSSTWFHKMGPWSDILTEPCSLQGILDDGDQYVQYRVILETAETGVTPVLHDVTITWSEVGLSPDGGSRVSELQLRVEPVPSRGATFARFTLDVTMPVEIMVFDLSGRRVSNTVLQNLSPGTHSVPLQGFSPGVYFCRLEAGGLSDVQRFVVIE